ncbi:MULTISPECIES: protein phosphatase CheZ [unclassified Nitrosomonas]|nr:MULTISPECIES: protein phosphatase CheZ [unclassified Nitrosomonas]MEB2331627.1 protein phosphatase CheZ [Nitrosomonas sp.]QOJ09398.1 MAG: protein phosphatase CheZ [Nitrosomonas sp. H1_AOB3]HNR10469.1 protein phosphatase CheZ [Nitrosomonas europaea]HNS57761.1 protein phosphatase CheZ [Nitrosomonas europaea]
MNNSFDTDKKTIDHPGQLARVLHNCLSELGYDWRLRQASHGISNSKDGLNYIASKTTQAAECSLLAVENARPILNNLSADAANLHKLWCQIPETTAAIIANQPTLNNALKQTLDFLNNVSSQAASTQACLTEIMIAQNFHDLTGQVIQNISRTIETVEQEMLQLLANDSANEEKEIKLDNGLLNGPVVNPQKQDDVYVNQAQADNLMTKLGL